MYRKSRSKHSIASRKNGSSPKPVSPTLQCGPYEGASSAVHLKPIPENSRRTSIPPVRLTFEDFTPDRRTRSSTPKTRTITPSDAGEAESPGNIRPQKRADRSYEQSEIDQRISKVQRTWHALVEMRDLRDANGRIKNNDLLEISQGLDITPRHLRRIHNRAMETGSIYLPVETRGRKPSVNTQGTVF